jgi:hypothetical protein
VTRLWFLAAGLWAAALPVNAQEKTASSGLGQATLFYRELYGLKKLEAEVSGASNVVMVIRMTSKNGVPFEQLEVFIDSKNGRIPLHFAPDGSFLMLMSDALYQENPYVRANQPKGTMRLDWGFFVRGVHGLEKASTYRELIAPVEESRKALATMAKHVPEMKGTSVDAMKLFFKPDPPVKITVHAKKAARTYEAEAGVCIIPYDAALARENPAVTMPAAPDKIDFVVSTR